MKTYFRGEFIMEITKLFKNFFDSEKAGGLVLVGCTIISILIANGSWGQAYTEFWHRHVDLSFGGIKLDHSIEYWVNDGLMTIFFLLVGLEIERELYIGELKEIKVASLPIAAAIGGMLVPAAIHYFFNGGTPEQSGYGIPMATDIAFALGVLALLGNRVPFPLKIFLTAFAIIDDLGAILVIAIFYSEGISWPYLLSALGIFVALFVMGKFFKVHNLAFYLIPGIAMWYCMLQSGVHATITGVLLAFAIPFGGGGERSSSYRLQHFLHKPVAFIILPIFALANTGLILSDGWTDDLATANSLGIIIGLVLGKPIGIFIFSLLLIKMKWGSLPSGVTFKQLLGAGILGGIGFTMSIFITNLAFNDAHTIQSSKISILAGSAAAAILGLCWLGVALRKNSLASREL